MNPPDEGRSAAPAAEAGIPGPERVEVTGPLRRARFPELCVRCGWFAERTLPVTRLFWRTSSSEGPSSHVAATVDAPFCAECIRTHQAETRPIDRAVRRRLLRGWMVQALPYLVPLGVNLWVLTIMAPKLSAALAETAEPVEVLVWGAVCAFFGLLALLFLRMVLEPGRRLIDRAGRVGEQYARVERGPLGSRFMVADEPTSVTRALCFTDDRSDAFEPERHLFTFENNEVGAKFAELNADREWDPESLRARVAHAARWGLVGAVLLAGLYVFLRDLFR